MTTRDPKPARLEDIRIASPCEEPWGDMVGDDRQRDCARCAATVYDVSSMTRAAAEELLASTSGRLCVTLARRRDGRVITSDCPVGRRRIRLTRVVAVAAGGLLAALAALSCSTPPDPTPSPQKVDTPVATASTPTDVAPPVPAASVNSADPVAVTAPVASASASPRPTRKAALRPLPKRKKDPDSIDEFLLGHEVRIETGETFRRYEH